MRKKKNQPNWLVIILGFFIIGGAFFFSLSKLTTIISPIFVEDNGQSAEVSKREFLLKIAPKAKQLQEGYGILPSIIIGQAILESNWGSSQLASEYKNLFGVKAYGSQAGVELATKEFVNEQWITIKGKFRVYQSWEESLEDHTLLIVNGVSWNPQKYEKVLTAPDYRIAATELQKAGYATDPDYAKKIKEVIESYNLTKYD